MGTTEKKAIGVNLKMGNRFKRLWFSVEMNEESKQEFEKAYREIEAIGDEKLEWLDFLNAVEENFKSHYFERIAI